MVKKVRQTSHIIENDSYFWLMDKKDVNIKNQVEFSFLF
jgi:hypothetical protein